MSIAIQGYPASFHDQAAQQFFGAGYSPVTCDTFGLVFDSVASGRTACGLVAIENSLYGSINEVYDLLLAKHIPIIGEVYLRIEHCLIGLPGAKLEDITEVHSHPVALAQCEDFLDTTLASAERFEHHDTAASVADIKKWADKHKAAIASSGAAKLHGMNVLASNIETHHNNYTRFVAISNKQPSQTETKTSLVLKTADKPGALYHALGAFAGNGINLSKLQSRPVVGSSWHYMFYVDVEAGLHDPGFEAALKQLKKQQCETILLGSYAAAKKH